MHFIDNGFNKTATFNYTGYVQKVKLWPGNYFVECYGGKGGGSTGAGGDKASGYIKINRTTELYLNIGQQTNSSAGGWNDGKKVTESGVYGGGGATDISMEGIENSTNWNNTEHLNSIIIQAAGGQGQGKTGGSTTGGFNSTRFDARTEYVNRFGVYVANFTPTASGTLLFQSTSFSHDPYGFIDDEAGNNLAYNDDGAGNLNFKLTYSVTAGKLYRLRIGSYSQTLSTTGYTVWFATYPVSLVKMQTVITSGGFGGGKNYFHSKFYNTSITNYVNLDNGKIVITKLASTKTYFKRRNQNHALFVSVFASEINQF